MKKYTAIYQKYRGNEIQFKHIECTIEDLSIYVQGQKGWNLLVLLDGYVSDVQHLLNNREVIPIEYRKCKMHSSFNFLLSKIEKNRRRKNESIMDQKIKFLINKIEDNKLDYEDWYNSYEDGSKISFITNHIKSTQLVIIFISNDNKFTLMYNDFYSGTLETLPLSNDISFLDYCNNGAKFGGIEFSKMLNENKLKINN